MPYSAVIPFEDVSHLFEMLVISRYRGSFSKQQGKQAPVQMPRVRPIVPLLVVVSEALHQRPHQHPFQMRILPFRLHAAVQPKYAPEVNSQSSRMTYQPPLQVFRKLCSPETLPHQEGIVSSIYCLKHVY